MPRTVGALVVLALSFAGFVHSAAPAEAGILVMKNGNVIIGRIRPDELSDDFVVVRWPYNKSSYPRDLAESHGSKKFEAFRIRWYSIEADDLTDDYFKKHGDKEVESRFKDRVERWKAKKSAVVDAEVVPQVDQLRFGGVKLSAMAVMKDYYEIRKPDGWRTESDKDNEIFMVVAPEKTGGYASRIHVFSVAKPKVSVSDQISWIKAEAKKLSTNQILDIQGVPEHKIVAGKGTNVTLTTITRRNKIAVRVQRHVFFRKDRVYFVYCYAETKEFNRLQRLYRDCVKSLVIFEDERIEDDPK